MAALTPVIVALIATAVGAASATPLRQPTTPIGVPLLEAAGERAPRIGPLRARPAPASGIDQPLGVDPVLAPATAVIGPVPGPFRSFEGISNGQQSPLFGELKLPADTTGDVGPNHYVQAVNTTYMVLDKNGTQLTPPIPFAGPGGLFDPADSVPGIDLCDDHNRGDPIVLYDELAKRWVIGQFAFTTLSDIPQPPFKQCVAVSASNDPFEWFLYEFELSNLATQFPDYPKLGVWHDAYYVSANAFDLTQNPAAAVGGFAVALERDVMLAGGSNPQMVAITPPGAPGNQLFGLLPADLDGGAPPAGAPGLFLTLEDTNFGAPADGLRLWEATVNWTTPSISLSNTFLPVAEFDSALCGGARNCIPQANTLVGLDPLSGQLLHRLAYRNFGSRQALATTHVADATGGDQASMRWYELQNTGAGWGLAQQSTFAPDADHRWMGSIALDASGNVGLGYTTSSNATFPSLNYSGRYATDPANVLTQGEGTLMTGGGSQLSTTSRWGDYSTLSVDPTDGCTFWFTSTYYPATANALWHTRIGSFSLLTDPALVATAHTPGAWSSDPTVELALAGANASCGMAGFSVAWSTDPTVPTDELADADASTTAIASPALAEGGGQYVRVRTVDGQGNAGVGSTLGPFLIDTTAPAQLAITPELAAFQKTTRFPVRWTGIDALSGIATYDVRYRRAPTTSGFGPRKSLRAKTRKTKSSLAGRPGSTYCFSVRATDVAGNGAKYGSELCSAVPLDDRALLGKQGWKRLTKSKAFRRTSLLTKTRGASLSAKKVRARSFAILATRCGRCGIVEVRHRGRLVGTVDLAQKPYGAGLVNELPSVKRLRKGKVTMTVVSSGQRVVIDGVGISRTRADR